MAASSQPYFPDLQLVSLKKALSAIGIAAALTFVAQSRLHQIYDPRLLGEALLLVVALERVRTISELGYAALAVVLDAGAAAVAEMPPL